MMCHKSAAFTGCVHPINGGIRPVVYDIVLAVMDNDIVTGFSGLVTPDPSTENETTVRQYW